MSTTSLNLFLIWGNISLVFILLVFQSRTNTFGGKENEGEDYIPEYHR
jgi:ABC-type cobalt transport system substrate-binding protein